MSFFTPLKSLQSIGWIVSHQIYKAGCVGGEEWDILLLVFCGGAVVVSMRNFNILLKRNIYDLKLHINNLVQSLQAA